MPILPSRIQGQPYGSQNPSQRRRARPVPILLQKGPALGLEQTNNRQINRIQQATAQALGVAKARPDAQGNMLENVTLVAGPNVLKHGLPQAWRGVEVTNFSASATWHRQSSAPSGSSPSATRQYDAATVTVVVTGLADGASLTANVWVY